MPAKRKKSADLQKKIKSLRLRIAKLKSKKPRQKQTDENALLYQTLMKNINLGITLIDTEYRVITTNAGQGKILKKPRGKFVGKYCFKEFEKRSKVCSHCPGTRAMATRRPAEVETTGVRDDGSHVLVRIQAFPIFENDGTIKGFLEVVEDITKHKQAEKALRDSEELYRTLVENIGLGINLIDAKYRIIMTNIAHAHFMKKARGKFLGNYCFREFAKRNTVCPNCPGKKAMATRRPADVETEGIGDDGSRMPVHIQAFPVFDADGTVKGFTEVVEDLTERRRTEENLRESEQRFKAIVDNAPDGILLVNVESKKFYLGNKAMCRTLGYEPEEIKKLAVPNIHPKEHLSYVIEQFEKQARKEITVAEDIPVKKRDGSIFYADISSFPITFGGKTYLAGIFRDITESKKAREELQQAEAKYRTLVEQIPAVTYTTALDKSSTTAYISPQILQLAGFSPEECGADPDLWRKQLHPEDRQRVLKKLKQSQKGKQPFNCEYRLFSKDGRIVWCRDEAVVVRDNSGRSLMLQGVMFDITAQKQAEEELNVYREKMARAERLASLGTLSATVAHELTQPLTVIRLSIENSLEDLKAQSCPKDVLDILKDGLNEVSNATSTIDRFRNYARQSSGKTFCKTNLSAIAGRIVYLLGKTAQSAKMTLHLKGVDKLPPVYSNEKDLNQLFFALTENAIQAADGKKTRRLIIAGDVKGENIELQFSDNCRGIAPENLGRIFEPFFTTGNGDERTGLGLPIVKRIVSENGGKIDVKSRPGKGTTFYVTLPIHPGMAK
ncbi:MAG: PAS domain S-box protein [Phycisphaerae bacterium]|nr:PAS domain S-box protein [Phycisphaerae bacterium]MDD5380540.1 PAS domain S-box protein [Phycisphaerae bacterium]